MSTYKVRSIEIVYICFGKNQTAGELPPTEVQKKNVCGTGERMGGLSIERYRELSLPLSGLFCCTCMFGFFLTHYVWHTVESLVFRAENQRKKALQL